MCAVVLRASLEEESFGPDRGELECIEAVSEEFSLVVLANTFFKNGEVKNTINSAHFLGIGPQGIVGRGGLDVRKEEYDVAVFVSWANLIEGGPEYLRLYLVILQNLCNLLRVLE